MTSYAPDRRRMARGQHRGLRIRIPPVFRSPARSLPIPRIVVFVKVVIFVVVAVIVKQDLPIVFPTSPPLPLSSSHRPQMNASANPSRSLDMHDPWYARRMPITRSAVSLPDNGPVCTIASLIVVVVVVAVVVIRPPPPRPPPCRHRCRRRRRQTPPWHPPQARCSRRQSAVSAHPIEVASEVFLVVFAEEFHADPVNVSVFVGASIVHLAAVS